MAIDIHAHYVPPQLIAQVAARGKSFGVELVAAAANGTPALSFAYGFKVRPFFPKLIENVAQRRASLDRQRLDRQFVATWPDIYGYGLKPAECVEWHRMLNDTLAEWCGDNADRFSFVASLPLPSAEDAMAELSRAVTLGAMAVMVPANIEGVNVGDLALDPLWARAEQLRIPIILHPVLVEAAPRGAKYALAQVVQYPFDTTLGIGSLISSGVLDRFPDLTFVLSHGGGAFPYLIGRFDIMHARMDRAAQKNVAQHAPSHYASRFAYDTIVHDPRALRFLAEVVGSSRVMLGTDESFPPADNDPLQIVRTAFAEQTTFDAISEANARRIFAKLP